ncbi:glycosyltransferase family 2 protein [Halobacteriovorax sp. GB3]|uniref:glycosyltransferase family 2 protein n=1 Tax=Halobacteriovorax sp. GB3 TaxID=2719615 RepID=UPI0023623D6A|nr:glycosyltransferase family 2 protein [Halobacteriovorax sp. GB3]MDD0852540.1 glycosyltransferase family 2 protein [Halobacteriovorax sp. GB3]
MIPKSKSQLPILSIMIPTFKRPDLIRETIQSALNQDTDLDFKIVVVDNDIESSEISKVVSSFDDDRLSYVQNEANLGMFGNWNRCLELCETDWVTILHDDDLLYPDFISRISPYFTSGKYELVSCLNSRGKNVDLTSTLNRSGEIQVINPLRLVEGNIVSAPGVVYKKKNALAIKGFDKDSFPCSDYEFYINYIQKFGNSIIVREELAFYRIFDNETYKSDTLKRMILKTYEFSNSIQGVPAIIKKIIIKSNILNGWLKDLRTYDENYEKHLEEIKMKCDISDLELSPPIKFSYRILKFAILFVNNFCFRKSIKPS